MNDKDFATIVRVFCYVGVGYYGFGLTPVQAWNAAVAAGNPKTVKAKAEGTMLRLPLGVERYMVDGMGTCRWWMPESLGPWTAEKDKLFQADEMTFDKGTGYWKETP